MNDSNIIHLMTTLVFQVGVILFAAKLGGILFEKLKIPSVVGEFVAGMIIGPYLLGHLALPGFPNGLFPINLNAAIPISPQLYGLATIASILLLFMTGLETNLNLLLRFSAVGILVGIGGILAAFITGAVTAMLFFDLSFMDPVCLLLGVISSATSVGITARILSTRRKMDSPEGVTIMAGAVIDDVLSIVILAVVIGIAVSIKKGGGTNVQWRHIGMIALKTISVWLGFTALGLLFAKKISLFLKKFKDITTFSILAFGLALLIAGVFEKSGLAMIIGAYIMGLSLSNTDLSYAIQGSLHSLRAFFIPIFFTVMGMLVNLKAFSSGNILIFGIIYSLGAVAAKLLGCGLASLLGNFNSTGALRIGLGMMLRGEVALIIAGMGLSYGIINKDIFGSVVMMPLFTSIIGSLLFDRSLMSGKKGTKKDIKVSNAIRFDFKFPSSDITQFIRTKILQSFNEEGFFVNRLHAGNIIFYIRKDDIVITMTCFDKKIMLDSSGEDVGYVKTLVYESLLDLHKTVNRLKEVTKPEKMKKGLISKEGKAKIDISKTLDQDSIIMNMKGETKNEVMTELIDILDKNKKLLNRKKAHDSIIEREKSMSTGMQKGLAFPHGKTDGVSRMVMAVGFKRKGIDFQSIDGKPCKIIIMIVAPEHTSGPHIQLLAGIGTLLKEKKAINSLLACKNKKEVWGFFKQAKS